MNNLERRLVANLSIPRNVQDLANQLRSDPFSGFGTKDESELERLIKNLTSEGYIASVGLHEGDAAELVKRANAHKQTYDMHDDKAKTLIGRLQVPSRRWRAQGEQWMLTKDGFDKLHDPTGIGDPTPMPTWVVEQRIREEFDRVHKGSPDKFKDPTHNVTLGDKLLEDEFAAWAKSVADRHEEETGERPQMPIAGGAGYADATELLILDPENGKGSAYTETAPWFMAAVTVAVTDADTGSTITEANYTGYARKSVAAADMASAAAGSAANVNAITFAACTAGTSAVIGFAKCVASTVGRLVKFGTCTTVNVSSTQQPLNFAVGAFTTTLD